MSLQRAEPASEWNSKAERESLHSLLGFVRDFRASLSQAASVLPFRTRFAGIRNTSK